MTVRAVLLTSLVGLITLQPTAAQPIDRVNSQHQTLVTSAVTDFGTGQIRISGKHFGATTPLVTLDGIGLSVSGSSESLVYAFLPSNIPAGSYMLKLTNVTTNQADAFYLTVGSAGPAGAQGPQSLQGPAGAPGAQGAQGLPGPPGLLTVYRRVGGSISAAQATVGTVSVPAGSYFVVASVNVRNDSTSTSGFCLIANPGNVGETYIPEIPVGKITGTIVHSVLTMPAAGIIELRCHIGNPNTVYHNFQLSAVPVNSVQ
jgi:hypothetical protein